MVDFKALMDESPEAKAQRARDLQQSREEFEKRLSDLVAERTVTLTRLKEGNFPFNEFEAKFVDDNHRKSTRRDQLGTHGGDLAFLSDKQVQKLNEIADRYLSDEPVSAPKRSLRP